MSKRELSRLAGSADVEGSRPKRRRDTTTYAEGSSDVDVTMSEAGKATSRQNGGASNRGNDSLKELGLHLLQTVKEAKAKDGRQLAAAFLTKPPRKIYPDYYQVIKTPIALDDIKKRLDSNVYPKLQAVMADFELLFNNAMTYNIKDSVIWKDARDMLKLAQNTYEKLAPLLGAGEAVQDDDDKRGNSTTPSLDAMIRSRLQKLIEKTDKDGRTLSTEFMQLPNRKQWAIYYQQIKNPRCFDGILKKLKRKDYHTSADFASDVELIFSNAMDFNLPHSGIWEDALTLRDYFRQLMSDLPSPYNLPEYSSNKAAPNKIRIKPPLPPSTKQVDSNTIKSEPSSSTLLLRVPAVNSAAAKASQPVATPNTTKAKPPASSTPAAPPAVTSTAPTPAATAPAKVPIAPQPQRPAQQPLAPATQTAKSTSATPQPSAASQQTTFTYSHYYQPLSSAPTPSATTVVPTKPTPAASHSPAPPPIHPNHQIKFVKMRVQPNGRLLWLDRREGVKTWAIKLVPGEVGLDVDDLVFVGDEEGEESSEEEEEDDFKQEEEEDEMDVDGSSASPKNGKVRKGKAAARRAQRAAPATTRTTRSAVAKNKIQEMKKEAEKVEQVLLKLDGTSIKEKEDAARQWNVSLSVGAHILEVGEKDGLMWKVYFERLGD